MANAKIVKGFKLVDADLTAHGGFQYVVGKWATATGTGGLCSEGKLHFYRDALLAELLNPIHGSYPATARLFEIEARTEIESDRGLKYGAKSLRLVREIERPQITLAQRVAFAKKCAEWAKGVASGPRQDAEQIHAKLAAIAAETCK